MTAETRGMTWLARSPYTGPCRVVAPRTDPVARGALGAAKGAQHIVHGAGVYNTLEEALRGTTASVAFHRWCARATVYVFKPQTLKPVLKHESA